MRSARFTWVAPTIWQVAASAAMSASVCPMDIPISLLNRKLAQEVESLFGHQAGMQPVLSPIRRHPEQRRGLAR